VRPVFLFLEGKFLTIEPKEENKSMSGSELRINRFANFVEADNVYGAREILKESRTIDEEIMMKAILIKASASNSLSPAMCELANGFME
jgi:hypothetical protein